MSYNNQDINHIKNDIKSIKLMFLGLLITTPIYYTSIYLLSKRACKNAFLAVSEYINVVEKNITPSEIDVILEEKLEPLEDELNNLVSSETNSDGHELETSTYDNIPHTTNHNKKGIFNFY